MKTVEEEDDRLAMEYVQRGEALPSQTRMERVRVILVEGVGYDSKREDGGEEGGRKSVEGRAIGFANRIGALALKMTELSAFRERQDLVFGVLAGIGA